MKQRVSPPIHEIARLAHGHGARILVDGAQLVPHRPVNMRGSGADDDAFSATPDLVGGGIVDLVTLNRVVWAAIPEREEAGSPNVIGVVALHAAIEKLREIGMDNIARHEEALTAYALRRLGEINGLRLLGRPTSEDRVGLFSFVVDGMSTRASVRR